MKIQRYRVSTVMVQPLWIVYATTENFFELFLIIREMHKLYCLMEKAEYRSIEMYIFIHTHKYVEVVTSRMFYD